MKNTLQLFAFLALAFFAASCEKENLDSLVSQDQNSAERIYLDDAGLRTALGIQEIDTRSTGSSLVYTMSNDAAANKVYAYDIAANGSLTTKGSYSTTGLGSGTDLHNQGALTTGLGGHLVYAVNPGSNDMSVFYALTDGSLSLKEKIATGGTQPISVTERNGIVYVLNAGGDTDASTITGFGYNSQAKLVQIPGSTMTVSASDASDPTQISFSGDGKTLVVTDRGMNTINTFPMSQNKPTTMYSYSTNGTATAGFAMGNNNMMMVTDAGSNAVNSGNGSTTANQSKVSSYRINSNGTVSLIDGPLTTDASFGGGAMVMSKSGNSLYALNSGSSSLSAAINISGFGKLSLGGSLTSTVLQSKPSEAAMDADSKNMFVLGAGTSHSLTSLSVNANGSLTQVGVTANLPDFSTGLIVR